MLEDVGVADILALLEGLALFDTLATKEAERLTVPVSEELGELFADAETPFDTEPKDPEPLPEANDPDTKELLVADGEPLNNGSGLTDTPFDTEPKDSDAM